MKYQLQAGTSGGWTNQCIHRTKYYDPYILTITKDPFNYVGGRLSFFWEFFLFKKFGLKPKVELTYVDNLELGKSPAKYYHPVGPFSTDEMYSLGLTFTYYFGER